ncbi:hypothetical protein BDW67DRAFT_146856 [Aspergillus spinulosporus]
MLVSALKCQSVNLSLIYGFLAAGSLIASGFVGKHQESNGQPGGSYGVDKGNMIMMKMNDKDGCHVALRTMERIQETCRNEIKYITRRIEVDKNCQMHDVRV